ncbi:MAG TPA: hypothetical protein VHH90_00375 [Polyangia bacterium]|nr:hypothetical protein [Polyangia bacterium]
MDGWGISKITWAGAFAGLLLSSAAVRADELFGTSAPVTDVASSADHVRANTEPPPFDANSPEAVRARKQAAAEAKLAPPKSAPARPDPRPAAPAEPASETPPGDADTTTAQVTATPLGRPVTATPFTRPPSAAPASAPVTATPMGAPVTATPSSGTNWVDPFVDAPAGGTAAVAPSVTATSPVTPDPATPAERPETARPVGADTVGAAVTTPAAPAATPAPAPADIDATGGTRLHDVVPRVIGVDSMGNSSGVAPQPSTPGGGESGATEPSARPAAPTGPEDAPLPPSFENDNLPAAPPSP